MISVFENMLSVTLFIPPLLDSFPLPFHPRCCFFRAQRKNNNESCIHLFSNNYVEDECLKAEKDAKRDNPEAIAAAGAPPPRSRLLAG